jgi:hypothetical protein
MNIDSPFKYRIYKARNILRLVSRIYLSFLKKNTQAAMKSCRDKSERIVLLDCLTNLRHNYEDTVTDKSYPDYSIDNNHLQYIGIDKNDKKEEIEYIIKKANRRYTNEINPNISCTYLSINAEKYKYKLKEPIIDKICYYMKIKLMLVIIISLWYSIMIIINGIFDNYRDNTFKVIAIPLFINLLVRFIITNNLMILVITKILILYGRDINEYNNKCSMIKIVYDALVSTIAQHNFKNILLYHQIRRMLNHNRNNENNRV